MMNSNEGVEKMFSSAHRAVNQMEYQVEVLLVAHSCPSHLDINHYKAALGASSSSQPFRSPHSCCSPSGAIDR